MSFCKRIIIEGCDGVGKDTFIKNFLAYIYGEGIDGMTPEESFGGRNFMSFTSGTQLRKRDSVCSDDIKDPVKLRKFFEELKRHPNRFHPDREVRGPKWGTTLTVDTFHSRDSSPEANTFLDKLDQGLVTDQNEIAKEYLQIHYDLERLCKQMDDILDIVIQNRSLVSYFAMQIHALGLKEHEINWGKLWRYADQKRGIFVHLTLPEDQLRERLRARQGDDFRGEVEDLYMSKAAKITEGFNMLKKDGEWMAVIEVDMSKPIRDYAEDFERILTTRQQAESRYQLGL